jgi:hypothetical protein
MSGRMALFCLYPRLSVNAAVGEKNWLAAREAMFNLAELTARQSLAESIKTLISSDRKSVIRNFGGDEAPASFQDAAQQLSLADRARVLSEKAVDSEIKRYDPIWNANAVRIPNLLFNVSQYSG